jgi:4-hydroxy-tetrahydrodipicolinate reductase
VSERDEPIRIGVFGAGGRMGSTVCAAVTDDPELELVAAVDPGAVGTTISGVTVAARPDVLLDAGATVAVDFTVLEAARQNARWCAANAIHCVIGTSGYAYDRDEVELMQASFNRSNCLVAPNFAIGAVLMMRFAALAAPYFDSAEIIEMHHDAKIDAPSGTATATAAMMAEASADWAPDPTKQETIAGARGAVGASGIHVHSVRLRGLVAHQEVLLGTTGQMLTIRHDSYDRSSFMPGVLLACKRVASHPGVTIGLDAYL